MKRLFTSLFVALLCCSIFAADLNPFAYKLTATYDKASNSVTIGYHLNAPASKVNIVVYKDEANPSKSQAFTGSTYTSAGAHTAVVSLHGLEGGDYSYKIEVYGKGQSSTVAFHKRTVLNSPFGIDIDNNMNSPWFGRTLVTQPTTKNNTLRGLFEYWPSYFTLGTTPANPYNGGTGNYYQGDQSWFYYSHATPTRVRIAQDGTGRIFTTACDVDMDTYLWYVDPANPNNWISLIKASEMKTIAGHPNDAKIYNVSLDLRVANNQINLLLLSASMSTGSTSFSTGYLYSGKYVLPPNFPTSTQGTYSSITKPTVSNGKISPHNYIKSGLLPVAINSSSQFDKYGGAWFLGTSKAEGKDPFDNVAYMDKSALVHIATNGNIKANYASDDENLKCRYTASGGFRSNNTFTQVLVANGYRKTARLYTVSQASGAAHPTLTFVAELGTIFSDDSNYITDFAWDHANNIYVVLRNGSSGYGIYTYATKYNANTPFVTKAPNTFEILCDANVYYTLTTSVNDASMGTVSAGGSHVSCSQVKVTATPKEGYRLENWTVNGTTVSKGDDNTYTLWMTDNMTVRANFASAVFNVTWWNLLNNKNDLDNTGDLDNVAEAYELIKVYFNDYNVKHNAATGSKIRSSQTIDQSRTFFAYGVGQSYHVADYIEGFVKGDHGYNAFKWLGDYINTVDKSQISSSMKGWYPYVPDFFNGNNGWSSYNKPAQWLPYYRETVCGLPKQMNFHSGMPIEIKEISPKKSEITNTTVLEKTSYPTWYLRNYDANRLLAWREGGTNPVNNRIVHHVDKSMALYATYVDKALQEDDPEPANQYDAKNDDILDLLANDKHGSALHNVTVDRKFVGGMYNTICLPFDLPVSLLPVKLKDAEIIVFYGVTETNDEYGEPVAVLNFVPLKEYWKNRDASVTDPYMEAGIPYLIKPKTDVTEEYLTYSGLAQWRFFDSSKQPKSETYGGVVFQGVFNPTTLEMGDCILVADNRLAKVTDTSSKLKGFRGYFKIEDAYLQSLADDGRLYLSMRKPVTSSIPVAPEAEKQVAPKARKIMRDGQIYILRGDEVYTITGHRVK